MNVRTVPYECRPRTVPCACRVPTVCRASAQGWNNRTLISHEPLVCSKMCFSKTEPVQ